MALLHKVAAMMTNKKGRDGWNRATLTTTSTYNFTLLTTRLHRLITIVRHVLITLPFECAMLMICFIVLAGVLL